jgi:hypothetical protein
VRKIVCSICEERIRDGFVVTDAPESLYVCDECVRYFSDRVCACGKLLLNCRASQLKDFDLGDFGGN